MNNYEILSPKYNNKYKNMLCDANYSNYNIEANNQYFKKNYKTKENLNNKIQILSNNNKNLLKKNKILNEKLILKEKEITYLKNISKNNNMNTKIIFQEKNMDYHNDSSKIKNIYKLIEEKDLLNNKLNERIKKLNEEISSMKNNNKINLALINQKSSKINEMNVIINKLKEEINKLKKQNEEQNSKIILLENDLIINKKEMISKNDKINNLNDKYIGLLSERNKINQLINELNKNKDLIEKEKQNEIINFKKIIEELEIKNNTINNENINLIKNSEEQNKEINKLEELINLLNEKIKKNNINGNTINNNIIEDDIINNNINNSSENKNSLNSLDSIKILENNIKVKRPSTPSFKSLEPEKGNLEEEKNKDIIELNNLLLNKIKEYESLLNINPDNDIINKVIEINDNNNIKNNNEDINYYKNKYIYYFGLYKENKQKIELLEKENEDLNEQLKSNNINNNNLVTTFSAIKLNYQYNPNEYFILCDKIYKQFKWYLMKKQSEYNDNDTYDNLIWVSSLDVVDIDNYNEYSKDEEPDNIEMLNIIKKLEEKENIISKLSYKIEKLEKYVEQTKKQDYNANNSLYNSELFVEINKNNNFNNNKQDFHKKKNKSQNKIIKYFKNSINDDNIFNDNKCVITFRKDLSSREDIEEKKNKSKKILKTEEKKNEGVPLEKYSLILEKLNKTEYQFSKLQKENIELRKNQRFYLSQNNNIVNIIPNSDIDKEKSDNDNNCIINFSSDINKLTLMGNNFINNINDDGLGLLKNNQKEEIDNYKIKNKNLEKKLEICKEACKNILTKLKIPKKEKEEIKQILKYFDFTEEETLAIIDDKKNKNSKK